jgi:hypothetical protein
MGSALHKVLNRLGVAVTVAISLAGLLAGSGAAYPLAAPAMTRSDAGAPIVSKAHGFHCRSMLGWDPVAGVYRRHRHEGICRDYKRCLSQQKRCIFLLGRGFERWSYEALGADNARFAACMIRSGCY